MIAVSSSPALVSAHSKGLGAEPVVEQTKAGAGKKKGNKGARLLQIAISMIAFGLLGL